MASQSKSIRRADPVGGDLLMTVDIEAAQAIRVKKATLISAPHGRYREVNWHADNCSCFRERRIPPLFGSTEPESRAKGRSQGSLTDFERRCDSQTFTRTRGVKLHRFLRSICTSHNDRFPKFMRSDPYREESARGEFAEVGRSLGLYRSSSGCSFGLRLAVEDFTYHLWVLAKFYPLK